MGRAARRLVRFIAFGALRVSRVLERVGRGLAAATFTRAEMDAHTVREWEAFGEGGPIMGHESFAWETQFFARHIRAGDSILVVGAGTGRDVMPLLEAGHEVTALDITPRALEVLFARAREKGRSIETITASIVDAVLPAGRFDIVLFSWFSFGYLRGPTDRRGALDRSIAALRPAGRILISYPLRAPTDRTTSTPSLLARTMAKWLGGVEPEPGDQFVVSGTASQPGVFFTHTFTPADIEKEAADAFLNVLFHAQPTPGTGVIALAPNGEEPVR